MKKSIFTRLFALLCLVIIGGATAWADDNSTVANAPKITPDSQDYDGNISVTITVDEGCTIIYKWGSRAYTSAELQTVSAKNIDNNTITLSIKGKNNDRYLSAIAVKDNNGVKSYSQAKTVKYTYTNDTKKELTLTASDFHIEVGKTQKIEVTAKDGDGNIITGLTYHYTSDNEKVATVNENGIVSGIMAGNAAITVSFFDNDTYKTATVIVNIAVNSSASDIAEGTIFTNIADVRKAGQKTYNVDSKPKWILNFTQNNPATVIAVFTNNDPDLASGKEGKGNVFIIDNSGRALMIPTHKTTTSYTKDLKVGDKLVGTIIGKYKERTSRIPEFTEFQETLKVGSEKYTTSFNIDRSGEATDMKEAIYPVNEITDVYTISATNDEIDDNSPDKGDIVKSSYGIYLNTIVKVPGTIKKSGKEYYLVQDENTIIKDKDRKNRLFFNSSQIDVKLDDYVNTSGTFEGILVKRKEGEPKLVVLKGDFFNINKIYLDENDPENRIDDLVNAGAFDDEVDVYVHRTKLVNSKANAWNTLCFPFDLTAEEFKTAFGCELSALAQPKVTDETTVEGRYTKVGETDEKGNLLFTALPETELNITEGMPYLMKATGTQTACANTSIKYQKEDGTDKTPQDLMGEDAKYYAHIGQKFITVVPPHQIQGNHNNNVVNGEFYLRGLYGRKATAEDGTTNLYDNGSQKYQYISTAEGNYLKYLTDKNQNLKFPGMRAYFYFPNWDAKNNKPVTVNDNTNAKIHLFVEDNTTNGITNIVNNNENKNARIYNLAGQIVDESYKGIIIKNGHKYLNK